MSRQLLFILMMCATVVVTVVSLFRNEGRIQRAKELMANNTFALNSVIVLCFSIYILTVGDSNEKSSLKRAIAALVIALYAELRLTFPPFWLVFGLSYFMNIG